jgi:hypothetical protein
MRTKRLFGWLAPALVLAMATTVLADDAVPTHSCTRPEIPEKFQTQAQADQFMAKANEYRECINRFIESQNQTALRHQNAASKASEEWNRFAAKVNEKSTPPPAKKKAN